MNSKTKYIHLLLLLLMLIGCENDNLRDYDNITQQDYLIKRMDSPLRGNKELSKSIEELSLFKAKSLTLNNIEIDTSTSFYIEKGDYHSYTFPIVKENDSTSIDNLLVSKQKDGSYKSFLVKYNLTELEKSKVMNNDFVDFSLPNKVTWEELDYDFSNLFKSNIEIGDGLFYNTDLDYCYEIIHVISRATGILVPREELVDCPWDTATGTDDGLTQDDSGGGGTTNNNGNDPNNNTGNNDMPPIPPNSDGNDNGNTGNPSNTDPNSSNDNDGQSNTDDCLETDANGDCVGDVTTIIISEDELNRKKECKKITDFLNDNPSFKTKLQDLASDANLNLATEKGAGKIENQTAIQDYQSSTTFPQIVINVPNDKFEALAHNHPSTTQFSLSTFSPEDLINIAKLIKLNRITDDFVAFLSTKQGTHYAITINNTTEFLDLFFFLTFDSDQQSIPLSDFQRFFASKSKLKPLYIKYFDPDNSNRKISGTNPNDPNINDMNENDLKEFLNFMNEADAGFTLFETDNTFNTFTKLKLKSGNPERQATCD